MRSIRPLIVLGSLAVLVEGCLPPPTYSIRRSATVEHIEPSLRTGAPLEGPVQFEGHASAITAPEAGNDDSGLYVSKYDMGGSVRVRLTKGWDLDGLASVSSTQAFKAQARHPRAARRQLLRVRRRHADHGARRRPVARRVRRRGTMAMNVPYHTHVECASCTAARRRRRLLRQRDRGRR